MRRASIAIMALTLVMVITGSLIAQEKPATDTQVWSGELVAGFTKLRVLVKVKTAADGKQSADFFSIDQTDQAFPAKEFSFGEGKMKFLVPSLLGEFDGTLNASGTTASGTWKQGGASLPLTLEVIDAMPEKKQVETWKGTLRAGPQEFEFQIRVFDETGRDQRAVLDSFSESMADLPMELDRKDKQFNFKILATAAVYEGTISDDGQGIKGFWKQGGGKFPLDFERADVSDTRSLTLSRPQTPKPPFKWKAVGVETTHRATDGSDVTIRGTLSLPPNVERPPVVVLISGSGPQDRDCTIFQHKSFLVIADYLSSRGIATLRYDDRGTAKSTGNFATANSEDFAADVESLVEMLRARNDVDPERVALMGHSEGGLIAPIVAKSMGDKIHCAVLLAGPSVSGRTIITSQSRRIMEVAGLKADVLDFQEKVSNRVMDLALGKGNPAEAVDMNSLKADLARVQEMASGTSMEELAPGLDLAEMTIDAFRAPWMQFFLAYDPAPKLRELNVPVLAVFCENDLQVLPSINLAPMEAALKAAPTKEVTVTTLPGLNHLFQHSATGAPDEYVNIEETFATEALTLVGDWLTDHFKK